MDSFLGKRILQVIQSVSYDRHKLILLLGNFGHGKMRLLQAAAQQVNGAYVNVNLRLIPYLLELPRLCYADGVTFHQLIDGLCDRLLAGRALHHR